LGGNPNDLGGAPMFRWLKLQANWSEFCFVIARSAEYPKLITARRSTSAQNISSSFGGKHCRFLFEAVRLIRGLQPSNFRQTKNPFPLAREGVDDFCRLTAGHNQGT
jgi:hypothetical protein